MAELRRVCVFCGSSTGASPRYAELADAFGSTLAERGLGLVTGGASVGLMGRVADAALAAGGEVIGVIPRALVVAEVAHEGLTERFDVGDMLERKTKMVELADAFVALPGGVGTLDELFETWTGLQLGFVRKPSALLDSGDFYAPLLGFLLGMSAHGGGKPKAVAILLGLVFTLAQAFVEICDPRISAGTVHLQVYSYNDLYRALFERLLGPAAGALSAPLGAVLSRMLVIQGYLQFGSMVTAGLLYRWRPDE